MSKQTKIQLDTTLTAVLHRAGRPWRCLVGRVVSGRVSLVDHREFPPGQENRIEGWLDMHRAGRVIVVLPAASVICRTCPLPNASAEQLETALRLQAEAYLPGQAPPHRQAMAVLPAAPGETSRCGLVLAWPTSSAADIPPLSAQAGREVTFAPDVAAVAALMNGARIAEPLLWLDRRDGSIALGLTHAGGATFRATRSEHSAGDADDGWQQGVCRVVAETALSVNHTGPFVDSLVQSTRTNIASMGSDQAQVVVPAELMDSLTARLDGAARDAKFWSAHGIGIGVLLASANQLAGLTRMLLSPPIETPSILKRAAAALSDRRTALAVVGVCVLTAALAPLVISGLRLAILHWKLPDLAAHRSAVAVSEKQLVMYRDLRNGAWSMTKLLSDIACNTPEAVEVNLINIAPGQEIRISGKAKKKGDRTARESLALMEKQMRETGIFDQVHSTSDQGDASGTYEFDMYAKVVAAHLQARYPEERDYGKKTMAERLYPDRSAAASANSSEPAPTEHLAMADESRPEIEIEHPAVAAPSEADGVQPRTDPLDRSSRGSRIEGGREALPSGTPESREIKLPPSQQIPEPISPEQIKALNKDETRRHLSDIAKARQIGSIDPDTKKRLKDEWELLMNHMRELPKDKP